MRDKLNLTENFFSSPFLTVLNSSVNIEEDLLKKQSKAKFNLRFLDHHEGLKKHKVEYPKNMSNESMKREILHTALFEVKRKVPEQLYREIEKREG